MEMENDRIADYNVHNLTFLRNNSYPQEIIFDNEKHYFFMMDYYNLLMEKKLEKETDGYMTLAGSVKAENNTVAKRIMGIYSRKTEKDNQLFQITSSEKGTTSESPFLGIIQVYIADYGWKNTGTSGVSVQQAENFLELYETEIANDLNQILEETDVYHIYRTITSEDFCVVIRTSTIRKIYHAALTIMDIRNGSDKRVFFTYTNIGLECIKSPNNENLSENRQFASLHESVREKNQNVSFVLRFRIENAALEEIQALEYQQKNKGEEAGQIIIEDVNGMIGRYDLVVRLTMNEFMEIYPYFCMNVTGDKIQTANLNALQGRFSKILVEKMGDGSIQTINTRMIVNIYAQEKSGDKQVVPLFDEKDKSKIKKRTKCVMTLYERFKKNYENYFSADKYRYVELIRMLDKLIFSYENLAYEADTHINWFICSQYLENFFQNMIFYMNTIKAHIEPRAIEKFLDEFQSFISAFDMYLRLLQGINQNTIQSPRYDISSPIDGQKFLMAYSEFIDSVHEEYREDNWNSKESLACREKRRVEKTIIYPELTIKNLQLMEVFCPDKVERTDDDCSTPAMLICKIPMFEYFERPYDLIPLVLHEICHHMLILNRKERNEFLIKNIFERLAAEALNQVQNRYVKNESCKRIDALTKKMEECLADALVETFKERCANYEKYVFLHLTKRIENFACSYFEDEEQKQDNRRGSSLESIKSKYELLIREIYDDEKKLKEFQRIEIKNIGTFRNPTEMNDCIRKLFTFTSDLLAQINKKTIGYKRSLKLENLLGRNNQQLDDYLLRWAKENESEISGIENITERTQLLKNYLELTKRAFLLLTDAVLIQEDGARSFRGNLAEKFAKKAKIQLDRFRDENYYIYDQDKAKKAAFWEFEREEHAQQHFIEAMECIDAGRILDAIRFGVTNYREICADIIMCKWIGLTSFGYLRSAVTLAPRMQGYEKHIEYGALQWERLKTVLAVLITVENRNEDIESETKEIDVSVLQKEIWEYISKTIDCVKSRIRTSMEADESLDQEHAEKARNHFYEMADCNIKLWEKNISENKKIVWEGCVWDCLNKRTLKFERMDDYFPYFYKEANIFKRIYDMLETYGRIQSSGKLYLKSYIYEHILNIYRHATKARQLHKVVGEVAGFYNNPASEKKSNSQKLEDMLCFVQDYYYCNRIKKAGEV